MSVKLKLLGGMLVIVTMLVFGLIYRNKNGAEIESVLQWQAFKLRQHTGQAEEVLIAAIRDDLGSQLSSKNQVPSLLINGSISGYVNIPEGDYSLPKFLDMACGQVKARWEMSLPENRIKIFAPEREAASTLADPFNQ